MKNHSFFLPLPLLAALLSIFLHAGSVPAESNLNGQIRYDLAISFDLDDHRLRGTAHLTIPPGHDLDILLNDISATAIVYRKGATAPGSLSPELSRIAVTRSDELQELFISYEKTVLQETENIIEKKAITLLDQWYPTPSRGVLFSLSARLPKTMIGYAQCDTIPLDGDNTTRFSFSPPTESLYFIAAPFVVDRLKVRDDLFVYTYFLPEDRKLSREYLDAARNYLLRYEEMIGPYPYNHFAIVENIRPTGYSMPTFTLLGKSVIRLPFIKATSLGHEILHSWFGNSVEVDLAEGNWCEGLTSYLADWLYREDAGEGALNRKENLVKYHSYVTEDTVISLNSFTSASHYQAMAQAVRSVGYIRGAMVFHELRKYLGEEHFWAGLKLFYGRFRGKEAGWSDIQAAFEDVSQTALADFFAERLGRTFVPELAIENIVVDSDDAGPRLSFTLRQKSPAPFHFTLPLAVKTLSTMEHFTIKVGSAEEEVQVRPSSLPFELTIDPDYDLLRRLVDGERVAVWSSFMGPEEAIVAIAPEDEELYSSFLGYFGEQNWKVKQADELTSAEISDNNLILAGRENPLTLSLFATLSHPRRGMTLETVLHPLNNRKNVLLLSAENKNELASALPKLRHYGKYSYLHFKDGTISEKRFVPGSMGIHIPLASRPLALPARGFLNLAETIEAVSDARVIYVGESHTSMADHQLQYLIAEAMYRTHQDIAIGLEMFPGSSQEVLDQYVASGSSLNEREFLKRSDYFEVWKYDYRYYKPLIDFARNRSIPLIGLNTDKSVVEAVFRGDTHPASPDTEDSLLPRERDLSLPGYGERLQSIYNLHMTGGHGKGSLGGFIQAQAVWDEVMAQNIAEYLENNPEKRMIVLAGTQHVRKDNGIPPRVDRRIKVKQVVLMTENSSSLPASPAMADYFLFMPDQSLPAAGKIGISLQEHLKDAAPYLEVSGFTKESKADDSGLKEGDKLVSLNGFPVETMADVRIAILQAKPGETVTVVINRSSGRVTENHTFTVELYQPEEFHH